MCASADPRRGIDGSFWKEVSARLVKFFIREDENWGYDHFSQVQYKPKDIGMPEDFTVMSAVRTIHLK